jgi:hypothetical protein|tara:strand:- start:3388 stop:3762 length:375 start_codon:yes stop_codon:yes gene_type:complete
MNIIEKSETNLFKSEKDLLMYYHTAIRNVGLYTSISIAALLAAFIYLRNKKELYYLEGGILYIASIVFLTITILLSKRVIQTIKTHKYPNMYDLLIIPYCTYYINSVFLLISVLLFLMIIFDKY